MKTEILRFGEIKTTTPLLVEADQPFEMSVQDVLKFVNASAPPAEALKFLLVCKAARLNPFLGEAHLVLMGKKDPKWQTVIAKAGYLKRAQRHPDYDGHESGIVIREILDARKQQYGDVMDVEGTVLPSGWIVIGGWARVYRKGIGRPILKRVSIQEYGKETYIWNTLTCTMIAKVALVAAIREAFAIGDSYDESEVPVESAPVERRPSPRPAPERLDAAAIESGPDPDLGQLPAPEVAGPAMTPGMEAAPALLSDEQADHIEGLVAELHIPDESLKRILAKRGVYEVRELTAWDAQDIINRLEGKKSERDFAETVLADREPGAAEPDDHVVPDAPRRPAPGADPAVESEEPDPAGVS